MVAPGLTAPSAKRGDSEATSISTGSRANLAGLESGQPIGEPVDALHVRFVQGTVGGRVTPTRAVYERALARAIELRALVRELVGSLRR